AADRQQQDVDRVAFGDQLHVGEEAGVAGVVDRLAADVDQHPRRVADHGAVGQRVGVPGGHELDPAPVEADGAAEVRVADVLHPLLAEPAGQLDQADAVGPGPGGDQI